MTTEEMYKRIKSLTRTEIVNVAANCCGDIDDKEDENFCENECPYLDVREGEHNPHRFCRQWVMHDLLKLLEQES